MDTQVIEINGVKLNAEIEKSKQTTLDQENKQRLFMKIIRETF